MRHPLLVGVAVALALGATATTAVAGEGGSDSGTACVFNTQLRPENEVRTNATDPVDSTAQGHAQIKVRNDGTIEYKVFILNQGGELFHIGHIHRGASTVNGPVVVHLLGGPAGGTTTDAEHIMLSGEGAIQDPPAGPNVAGDICANPSNYYVNFHTMATATQPGDPVGAVRGQLG